MDRMDVMTPRQGREGKTFYVRLGVAFPMKNGGWSLSLDALPTATMNDKGQLETRMLLMPPLDKGASAPASSQRRSASSDDDGIPF